MQAAVTVLIQWCDLNNLSVQIASGYRSLEEQAELYAEGRTADQIANRVSLHGTGGSVTDAPPGTSAHNYGLAVDLSGPDVSSAMTIARALGFGTISWDPDHLEWPNWRSLLA
jgi:D-alanyl-D-alanine carboxypeptidase